MVLAVLGAGGLLSIGFTAVGAKTTGHGKSGGKGYGDPVNYPLAKREWEIGK